MAFKLSQFSQRELLAQGATAQVLVYHANDNHKHTVVVKTINQARAMEKNQVQQILRERAALMHLKKDKSPFIVDLVSAAKDDDNIYFVLEHIRGGELIQHVKHSPSRRFSVERCRFYTQELVCTLEHLHRCGFVHRDIKANNVLLRRNGHICLVDFGFAKRISECANERTSTYCGTKHAMAPEVVKRQPYSYGVDYWSLGVLVYEMLCGTPPFPYFFSDRQKRQMGRDETTADEGKERDNEATADEGKRQDNETTASEGNDQNKGGSHDKDTTIIHNDIQHNFLDEDANGDYTSHESAYDRLITNGLQEAHNQQMNYLHLPDEAQDFIRCLLTLNPLDRLGGARGDAEQVRSHGFFSESSWEQVRSCQLDPPSFDREMAVLLQQEQDEDDQILTDEQQDLFKGF